MNDIDARHIRERCKNKSSFDYRDVRACLDEIDRLETLAKQEFVNVQTGKFAETLAQNVALREVVDAAKPFKDSVKPHQVLTAMRAIQAAGECGDMPIKWLTVCDWLGEIAVELKRLNKALAAHQASEDTPCPTE